MIEKFIRTGAYFQQAENGVISRVRKIPVNNIRMIVIMKIIWSLTFYCVL
jgi:hypothetical protein